MHQRLSQNRLLQGSVEQPCESNLAKLFLVKSDRWGIVGGRSAGTKGGTLSRSFSIGFWHDEFGTSAVQR